MRRLLTAAAAAVLLLDAAAAPAAAQAIIEGDGAAALGVALRRLGTTKRVLMVAAHPDDENTALIAQLALGDGADVAYLSLTRGEGGQNLIGPELQEGLGLIRTEELLAARRLDGALQFFTRAYDFGYSRSAEETFRHWPREAVLGDVVEVVRRFRPDVIISVFSGTPADGHGQHQAAGILAREAFAAAAEPGRFPEHRERGLAPHAVTHLFQAMYRPPAEPELRVTTGELDPLFGRSRYQIAMQSRSRHRSQDMGRAEPLGPQATSLRLLASRADPDLPRQAGSLFAAVDTTLPGQARTLGAPASVIRGLESYERSVAEVQGRYNPLDGWSLAAPLARAIRTLDNVPLPDATEFAPLRAAVAAERAQAADALRLAAGIVVDAVADAQLPAAGDTFDVAVTVWNGGSSAAGVRHVGLVVPAGWNAVRGDAPTIGTLQPGAVARIPFRVGLPADARPTEAYFLTAARENGLYRWNVADSLRGTPFEPPAIRAVVELDAGAAITVQREAEFLAVDKAYGEVRQPVLVAPRASVAVEPRLLAIPSGDTAPRTLSVTVTSHAGAALNGHVRLNAPAGWTVAGARPVSLPARGDAATAHFTITPAPGRATGNGHFEIRASFDTETESFTRELAVIDYPHTRPQPIYREAAVTAAVFPVAIAPGLRIGYVEGAGDDGAAALRQLGAAVELLDAAGLAAADLSRFDAIVAGIRAYEVRPDLVRHNRRLLDFVQAGGTFVVQYNKYELVDGGFMPFAATMTRPHGRVTDPAAPVTLLQPEHPVLAGPNRITGDDFDGWVHERGLYYLASFDPRYTPLLAMADDGEQPLDGGLVAARVGSGWYVYTGLALFRQLPEGVPGAFRLLANLVSLGR